MARAVGLLGGTFDPVHLGHLRVAEEVREAQTLDELRLVPASMPPHRRDVPVASAQHRLRMVELAVADAPGLTAWGVELERPGPSYSIDTLRTARDELGADARLAFVVGRDAFADFHTWKDHERIFELADVVVMTRPPNDDALGERDLPVAARNAFCYDPVSGVFRHSSGRRVILQPVTSLDVSATDIRRRFATGRSVRFLVPSVVEQYVREHELYCAERT
jgi:nicotinate-nucleotide adenylyltransferase